MKYNLDQVAIEVTRRCNMSCAHCLRGDAQNIDIDNKYIDRFLENVDSIGTITFTGGEPALNVDAIEYVLEQCINKGIQVGGFYIVTNGKADPLPLAIASLKWYAYCDYEDELSGITISKDMFHDNIPHTHEQVLKGLSFFRDDKTTDFNKVNIINEGHAETLSGFKKIDASTHADTFSCEEWDDNIYRIESMIYLSANGDIKTNCDVAYNNSDYTIGNLNDSTIDQIITTQIIDYTGFLPF